MSTLQRVVLESTLKGNNTLSKLASATGLPKERLLSARSALKKKRLVRNDGGDFWSVTRTGEIAIKTGSFN